MRRRRGIRPALLALAAILGTAPAPSLAGSSWRCGNRLVSDGDEISEVARKCGEPTFRTTSVEFVTVHPSPGVEVTRAVPVEVWTYNRGPREFVRYLSFRQGRLVDLTEGDYGY